MSYLKNRLNFKKKILTHAQLLKLIEQNKKLLEQWNKTGISIKELQEHINNKSKFKLTEIEQLLIIVKNIGRGKQNVKQQKILENQIKRKLLNLNNEIKNKGLVGEKKDLKELLAQKKKSVSSEVSLIDEENVIEELLNSDRMSSSNSQEKESQNIRDFKLLKEALVILREKMAFVPVISPKKRNILEPWYI
tara:strand:- start:24 stop:599 length:576 start_codon:yes stop_codon:yes gene_type:complete